MRCFSWLLLGLISRQPVATNIGSMQLFRTLTGDVKNCGSPVHPWLYQKKDGVGADFLVCLCACPKLTFWHHRTPFQNSSSTQPFSTQSVHLMTMTRSTWRDRWASTLFFFLHQVLKAINFLGSFSAKELPGCDLLPMSAALLCVFCCLEWMKISS